VIYSKYYFGGVVGLFLRLLAVAGSFIMGNHANLEPRTPPPADTGGSHEGPALVNDTSSLGHVCGESDLHPNGTCKNSLAGDLQHPLTPAGLHCSWILVRSFLFRNAGGGMRSELCVISVSFFVFHL
jgi:hypothetical protein